MGYYTNFELRLYGEKDSIIAAFKRIEELTDNLITWSCGDDILAEILNGNAAYFEAKWHSRKKDIAKVATEFPDVSFTLKGQGEDREDWWIIEAQNGKTHISYCTIISPEEQEADNWEDIDWEDIE